MSEYTPGPWRVESSEDKYGNGSWRMVGANDEVVFSCDWIAYEGGGVPPSDDNTRLIAAVPELLAAMQKIIRTYEEADSDHCLDLRMANVARAAIAKAEGRQP